MSQERQLPLEHRFRPAAPGTAKPWLLVLMHGVGSNEEDLFGLAPAVPPQFHVLSLRAPHMLGPQAYAWFEFGVLPNGERVINEAQEAASRQLVAQTVTAASSQLGLPANRVVVGGFSQGGIMSLSLLLTQPQLLREIWGPDHAGDTHYLRVLAAKLRQKLGEDAARPRYLETEPGVGLRFRAQAADA